MVSQARSQCKTMLVNKALVLSVRRHHARVTHQIMSMVLSSAGARGAKGSNEQLFTFNPVVNGFISIKTRTRMLYTFQR